MTPTFSATLHCMPRMTVIHILKGIQCMFEVESQRVDVTR